MLVRNSSDELVAAIKENSAKIASLERTLTRVRDEQLLSERRTFRFRSSVPNPNNNGSIQCSYTSTNSMRLRTILINYDTTIGALTLTIGTDFVLVFPNQAQGFTMLTDQDIKVGNGDVIKLTAATWAAPKQLALAIAGEQVGDALWVA